MIGRFPGLYRYLLFILLASRVSFAQEPSAGADSTPRAAAFRAFSVAADRYGKDPKNVDAVWQFGRACFDCSDNSTNNDERALFAEKGIAACQKALDEKTNSAESHYYLGMNLGQLAQTRGISALKLVKQMEREFTRARELDEKLDYAGPDRNLGLLYRDAPSFLSIGNRSNSKKSLQRALELAADFPENHLNLIETFLKWSDRNAAIQALKAYEAIRTKAQAQLTGSQWKFAWVDWEKRYREVKSKIESSSRVLSPRQKAD